MDSMSTWQWDRDGELPCVLFAGNSTLWCTCMRTHTNTCWKHGGSLQENILLLLSEVKWKLEREKTITTKLKHMANSKKNKTNIFTTKLDLDSVGTIRSQILLKTMYLFCPKMNVVITLEMTLKVQKVNEISNSFFFLLNPTNILLNAAAVHTKHKNNLVSSDFFLFFFWETGHFGFSFCFFLLAHCMRCIHLETNKDTSVCACVHVCVWGQKQRKGRRESTGGNVNSPAEGPRESLFTEAIKKSAARVD